MAVGPITQPVDKLKGLYEAGMRCARMNFSHGSHEVGSLIPRFVLASTRLTHQLSCKWHQTGEESVALCDTVFGVVARMISADLEVLAACIAVSRADDPKRAHSLRGDGRRSVRHHARYQRT